MAIRDPIAQLVEDLEAEGRPSLAWVVQWSAGGRDPVQAAWEKSADGHAMRRLLQYAGAGTLLARSVALVVLRGPGGRRAVYDGYDVVDEWREPPRRRLAAAQREEARRLAAVLRRMVPEPPPLASLVRA